jgi:hypothetical protein
LHHVDRVRGLRTAGRDETRVELADRLVQAAVKPVRVVGDPDAAVVEVDVTSGVSAGPHRVDDQRGRSDHDHGSRADRGALTPRDPHAGPFIGFRLFAQSLIALAPRTADIFSFRKIVGDSPN